MRIILLICLILTGCAGYQILGVSTEKYMSNYRLTVSTNAPEVSVRKESEELLAVVLPVNTRISGRVSRELKNFTHPCRFEGARRAGELLLLFSCGSDVRVYPETYRGKVDIIFSLSA